MPAVCEICGKGPQMNYRVSFSHRRNKRRWNANVQKIRVWQGGSARPARVCTSCIKAGKVTKPPHRS
jgi:large subunit ribosomal protein L28